MDMVILTALGVGGATVIGALIGFIFKKISHRFSDIVLSFAAGVMLAAAVLGLIIPSVEHGEKFGTPIALLMTIPSGIFCRAIPPAIRSASPVFPEPNPTPAAIPSGRLCIAIAITKSKTLLAFALF